jgi:hypothetical protein
VGHTRRPLRPLKKPALVFLCGNIMMELANSGGMMDEKTRIAKT